MSSVLHWVRNSASGLLKSPGLLVAVVSFVFTACTSDDVWEDVKQIGAFHPRRPLISQPASCELCTLRVACLLAQ